ncbi:MAG TPA: hypothetical protein VFZ00_08895, partial [Solirubrobacter sp.]|nr:hypothetical protein [Solirubrobacter sp.]
MRRLLPLFASLAVLALPASAHAFTFYEWDLDGGPSAIVEFQGELHYTLADDNARGRSTLRGVQAAAEPILNLFVPAKIVVGPGDGFLWWIGENSAAVGLSGRALPIALPVPGAPRDLAAADAAVWVLQNNNSITCVTTAGVATRYPSALTAPVALVRGGDGALWAVGDNRLMRYAVGTGCAEPTRADFPLADGTNPTDIAAAATGNTLYISAPGQVIQVTPDGSEPPAMQPVPLGDNRPAALATNAEGAWWVDTTNRRIGRVTADLTVTEWALPRGFGAPSDLTLASDGSLWYV